MITYVDFLLRSSILLAAIIFMLINKRCPSIVSKLDRKQEEEEEDKVAAANEKRMEMRCFE